MTQTPLRPGIVAGWAATVAWIVLGIESIVRPWQVGMRDLWWMIPFGFTAVTFCYLHLALFYGLATWRARVLPRSVGWALILFEPGSLLTGLALAPIAPLHDHGAYSAGVEKGLALAFMAMGLQAARRSRR